MNHPFFESTFKTIVSFFQCLTMTSIIGSIVVIAALLIHGLLSRFVSARWLYFFWLVVLLRFVAFAVPESPTSFLNYLTFSARTNVIASADNEIAIPAPAISISPNPKIVFASESSIGLIQSPNVTSSAGHAIASLASWENVWKFASASWFIGLTIVTLRLLFGFRRVSNLIGDSNVASEDLNLQFEKLMEQLSINSKVKLRISSALATPSMTGILSPVVILPKWCAEQFSKSQLNIVLAHELIHIRRRDSLTQLLTYLIVALHWFNPLARYCASLIDSCRELSCDQQTVTELTKLRNDRETVERLYGQTILDIATWSRRGTETNYNSVILGGFIGSKPKLIKQRIAMLVKTNSVRKTGTAMGALCLLMLIAVGFTKAQTTESSSKPIVQEKSPNDKSNGDEPKIEVLSTSEPSEVPIKLLLEKQSNGTINLVTGATKRLQFDFKIPEFIIENPAVTKITPLSPSEVLLEGLKFGKTTIELFDPDNKSHIFKVNVIPNVSELKSKINSKFPKLTLVGIHGTHDGFIRLTGSASNVQILEVERFVAANSDLPIRNELTDIDMVAIEVQIYEVSKTKFLQLGVDWHAAGLKDLDAMKSISDLLEDKNQLGKNQVGKPLSLDTLNTDRARRTKLFVESLEKLGIAKLLDQLILVTANRQLAEFVHGGEVPLTVEQADGSTKIEFQSFGTKINIVPELQPNESMILEIKAEVSKIAKDLASLDGSPGFRVRRINAGVEMNSGETMVLVGDYRKTKDGNDESELVFLFTPRLIKHQEILDKPDARVRR